MLWNPARAKGNWTPYALTNSRHREDQSIVNLWGRSRPGKTYSSLLRLNPFETKSACVPNIAPTGMDIAVMGELSCVAAPPVHSAAPLA